MMENPTPQKEHEWLKRLVGDWVIEKMLDKDGNPEPGVEGTEVFRSLGDIWVLGEGKSKMGEHQGYSLMTLGYDPKKEKFVGSWVGSMMTNFWAYTGSLEGDVLTLESEGPSWTEPGKTILYRDIITMISDDHRTLSGNMQQDDGSWANFMVTHYRRKK